MWAQNTVSGATLDVKMVNMGMQYRYRFFIAYIHSFVTAKISIWVLFGPMYDRTGLRCPPTHAATLAGQHKRQCVPVLFLGGLAFMAFPFLCFFGA